MDSWNLLTPISHFDASTDDAEEFIARYRMDPAEEALALRILQINAPIGSGRYMWASTAPEDMIPLLTTLKAMGKVSPLGFDYFDLPGNLRRAVDVFTARRMGFARVRKDPVTWCIIVFMKEITTDLIPLAEAGRARRIEYCGAQRTFA